MGISAADHGEEHVASKARRALRSALAAIVPPLGAFAIEAMFSYAPTRWLVFNAAVIVSSWLGGLNSGIIATSLSAAIVWWYFVPPNPLSGRRDPMHVASMILFVVIGAAVSVFLGRLKRAKRNAVRDMSALTRAQVELEAANHQLQDTAKDLLASQCIFQAVIDHAPGIIVIKDLEGKLLLFNRKLEHGLEMTSAQLKGKTVYDLFPEPVANRRRATDEAVIKTRMPITLEEIVDLNDGTHVFLATAFPLSDERGKLFAVAWMETDITDRKHAEEALQQATKELSESKGLVQAVFDHSPNAIVVKDLDGKFILTNRQFEQGFGRTAEELRGKTDSDVLPRPSDVERHKLADTKAVTTGQPVTIEESGELQDGTHTFLETVFPLRDGQEHAFGIGWIGTEITEMKRAEEALRRTAADLKDAQRVGHIGSWAWDVKTDAVAWSEELYHIHGRDPSVAPTTFHEAFLTLFTPESMRTLNASVEKLMKDRKPFELELETILADGSNRWIAVRGEAVLDAAGQPVAVRGTSQVKQLQRMKEEWMSVIAHDLRQPIGVIKMAAELLPDLHVGEISAEERDITGRIRSAAQGLARMVDDLLDMSRIEARRLSLERVWADTPTAVRKTVAALAHLTGNCPVRVSHAGGPSQVFIDPMRFEQILGNLMSNAVKYGEKNGEIDVRTMQRAGEAEIAVTNRGKGISAEDARWLFTRFGRASATRGSGVSGLGLGLYIAKGLTEAHGGRMWVDSVPGKTTTFHFTLPSRAAAKEAA